jgi:hypothetical protein
MLTHWLTDWLALWLAGLGTVWMVNLTYTATGQGAPLLFKVLLGGTAWQVGAMQHAACPPVLVTV